MKKSNFKIYAELIKDNSSASVRIGEKTLLATVTSKGLLYTVTNALKAIYPAEQWRLTTE